LIDFVNGGNGNKTYPKLYYQKEKYYP